MLIRPSGRDRFSLYLDDAYAGNITVYSAQEEKVFSLGILIVPPLRRRGLARQALCSAVDLYFQRGFTLCRNFVSAQNEASIRLHERCGFLCTGTQQRDGQTVLVFEKSRPSA